MLLLQVHIQVIILTRYLNPEMHERKASYQADKSQYLTQ
jgi:hypothetical protein